MEDYAKCYIETFHTGIKNTKYKISGQKLNSSSFFHELNEKIKNVKENEGRLFFFGNGGSASFSNHMGSRLVKKWWNISFLSQRQCNANSSSK